MDAVNTVFLLAGDPLRVYRNTQASPVAGIRMNPDQQRVPFLIPGSGTLCVYSELDDRLLRTENAALFDLGILVLDTAQQTTDQGRATSKRRKPTMS